FIAYATGLYGLREIGNLKAGETLLVLGASGTTGSTAIEIAKAMGARVIACAGTEQKRQRCLDAGADAVIDYTDPEWRKAAKTAAGSKGIDVVYDPIGGATAEPALRLLNPGGRFLVVGFVTGIASIPLNLPLLKQCSIHGVNWGGAVMSNPAIVPPVISTLVEWTLAGKLAPQADQRFPLAQAGDAFAALFERRSVGTIVICPQE
ncbi:MAG: zinc-binding dehydrogenase, partial [Alcanivoracaceae bacterium]|nr:zinc-binding dehydrogenase [Alcanivoracaceae bacterium]